MISLYGFDANHRSLFPLRYKESVPLAFIFSKLVLHMVCTRESVPFAFGSASLSCFCLGPGTLFPFPCIAGLQLLFDLYNSYI
jgi:hypothetical protein